MPAMSPPPPTGTNTACSGPAPNCLKISMPTVPWPAITSGASKGGMKVRPSLSASARATALVSSNVSPTSRTSAPMRRTAFTLMAGVVRGMQTTAEVPRRCAESATPWAWLPADAVTTPLRSASGESWAMRL